MARPIEVLRVDCPENLGIATLTGHFHITDLPPYRQLVILDHEWCNLQERGEQCQQSCKLGTPDSPLRRYER